MAGLFGGLIRFGHGPGSRGSAALTRCAADDGTQVTWAPSSHPRAHPLVRLSAVARSIAANRWKPRRPDGTRSVGERYVVRPPPGCDRALFLRIGGRARQLRLDERIRVLVDDPPSVFFPARHVRHATFPHDRSAVVVDALDPLYVHQVGQLAGGGLPKNVHARIAAVDVPACRCRQPGRDVPLPTHHAAEGAEQRGVLTGRPAPCVGPGVPRNKGLDRLSYVIPEALPGRIQDSPRSSTALIPNASGALWVTILQLLASCRGSLWRGLGAVTSSRRLAQPERGGPSGGSRPPRVC